MSIGENLRRLRESSGMTQQQAADRLGVVRQTLSGYETGRVRPDIYMLSRLCQLYGTDFDGVVYGKARVLKERRRLNVIAVTFFVLLALLSLAGSAMLWCFNWFFPAREAVASGDNTAIELHFLLVDAREVVGRIMMAISPLVLVALLVLGQIEPRLVSRGRKAIYFAMLVAAVLLPPLPFAFTDPVYKAVDYYIIAPMNVMLYLLAFFVVDGLIDIIRRLCRRN